jgi:hypothetical protein
MKELNKERFYSQLSSKLNSFQNGLRFLQQNQSTLQQIIQDKESIEKLCSGKVYMDKDFCDEILISLKKVNIKLIDNKIISDVKKEIQQHIEKCDNNNQTN